jgi:hypothetical protein
MSSYPSQLQQGSLIQTTFVWNAQEVQSLEINNDLKRLLVQLYTNLNNVVLAINAKDTGLYVTEEFLTGQQFFSNPSLNSTTTQNPEPRQTFRKVINFGNLPNAGSKSVPHNINIITGYSFTRIYGCATLPTSSFIPLPYASTVLNENISLSLDATNVTITTGIDRTLYTTCYVVVEFIKQ